MSPDFKAVHLSYSRSRPYVCLYRTPLLAGPGGCIAELTPDAFLHAVEVGIALGTLKSLPVTFARLSYQAIIAETFVIFPLVSRSTFADDKTRRWPGFFICDFFLMMCPWDPGMAS